VTQQNIVTVIVVVASAIIPYLISQQDVAIPPTIKVILTAANIGLVAFARLSNGGAATTTITTTAPSSTTMTTTPEPPPGP
jgi:hypothetical protein